MDQSIPVGVTAQLFAVAEEDELEELEELLSELLFNVDGTAEPALLEPPPQPTRDNATTKLPKKTPEEKFTTLLLFLKMKKNSTCLYLIFIFLIPPLPRWNGIMVFCGCINLTLAV
ncbi:MAG: hypothetical protein B5M52_06020 [Helicobacteraceae bacterium 4484_230]|nr:MAG: hypothetical protein B5M52_06020 [Helicobacteraceae bacterium 4484_230]